MSFGSLGVCLTWALIVEFGGSLRGQFGKSYAVGMTSNSNYPADVWLIGVKILISRN